ncbi:MAG: type IX secretion system membrane protein PorP/SprF [Bernardetiaceae bacterium]|nr:type IX secretion system membrane protein PorP/SprF [Bernardetiaceae bacterium]
MKQLFFIFGFLVFVCMVICSPALGQQIPLHGQYFQNQYLYNPAFAGNSSFGSASLLHRRQWLGIDGAPVTTAATFDFPFFHEKCGFGLNIMQDEINIRSQTRVSATYAYHLFNDFERASRLSMGVSLGVLNNRLDLSRVRGSTADPKLFRENNNATAFDAAFGLNYMFKEMFQLSLALPQLVNTDFGFLNNTVMPTERRPLNFVRHYLLSARVFLSTRDYQHRFEPLVMLRKADFLPVQLDAGLLYTYRDLLWGSITYRSDYALSMGLGVHIDNRLDIGYVYDLAINELAGHTGGGSHELMISYRFRFFPPNPYTNYRGTSSRTGQRRVKWHPSQPGPHFEKRKR